MVVYIKEKFMGKDILAKASSLEQLHHILQAMLEAGEDLKKVDLLDRKFKSLGSTVKQMTADCVMFEWKNKGQIWYKSILLEGVL